MQKLRANENSFEHILLLRCNAMYLVLMTAVDPRKRFPLDAFMRVGDYTSAYLWLNIKAEKDPEAGKKFTCWESQSNSPGFAARNATRLAAVVPTTAVKAKQFTKVNEATTCGMNILALLWMKVMEYGLKVSGQKVKYKHLQQPHKALTTAESGLGVDSDGGFTVPWTREVKEWAGQWGPTDPPAPPPPPPARVHDVYVGPFYDGTENPTYEVIHLLMKANNGVVITNNRIEKTSEVENRYSRIFTAIYDDGTIAFEKVASYCYRGIPLCCINTDPCTISWGLHPDQKPHKGDYNVSGPITGQGCRVRLQVGGVGSDCIQLFRDHKGGWCSTPWTVNTKGIGQ
jgi:hypothetical protein